MRSGVRGALFAFSFLYASAVLCAQQSSTSSPPTRDQQAISILNQCLQAAGGAQAIGAIQDFTASGSITYNWAGESVNGSVTLKGRGKGQFRLDADLSNGRLSWAVNNGDGFYKELDETTRHIFYANAVNFGSLTLPYVHIAAGLNDQSTSLSYIGVNSQDNRKTYDIRIQQALPPDRDPTGILGKLTRRDFFIDTQTFQIVRVSDMVHPEKITTIDIPHEIEFSDYRSVNGVALPFSISEKTDGQHTYTIQISQISFNSGLQDADFQQ